jgi:hypothetical protein
MEINAPDIHDLCIQWQLIVTIVLKQFYPLARPYLYLKCDTSEDVIKYWRRDRHQGSTQRCRTVCIRSVCWQLKASVVPYIFRSPSVRVLLELHGISEGRVVCKYGTLSLRVRVVAGRCTKCKAVYRKVLIYRPHFVLPIIMVATTKHEKFSNGSHTINLKPYITGILTSSNSCRNTKENVLFPARQCNTSYHIPFTESALSMVTCPKI